MEASKNISLKVKVWRQNDQKTSGRFVEYALSDLSTDMSILEMLDVLNDQLIRKGEDPVSFDHDCREGICGSCAMMVNGLAHGGIKKTTVCQVYLRSFKDGDSLVLEPWRAKAFPVLKDLCVDRSSFDRIIQSGGYISVNTGNAPDGNAILIPKKTAETAFDAGECIQCGACVAACKNASAMLFVAAQVERLNLLPQGQVEKNRRVKNMVATMDAEKFGACTNEAECSAVCPKGISFKYITLLNKDYLRSQFSGEDD